MELRTRLRPNAHKTSCRLDYYRATHTHTRTFRLYAVSAAGDAAATARPTHATVIHHPPPFGAPLTGRRRHRSAVVAVAHVSRTSRQAKIIDIATKLDIAAERVFFYLLENRFLHSAVGRSSAGWKQQKA